MDEFCNAAELSYMFDTSPRRISILAKDGIIPKSRHGKFPIKECVRAYLTHVQKDDGPIDTNQEKARLTKAQADKTEIEVAAMRGEVVAIQSVIDEVDKMLKAFRQKALTMPSKISPLVYSEKSVASIRAILEDEVNEVLSELSSYTPEGSSSSPSSATKVSRKRGRPATKTNG
jgi:hypothetical protein